MSSKYNHYINRTGPFGVLALDSISQCTCELSKWVGLYNCYASGGTGPGTYAQFMAVNTIPQQLPLLQLYLVTGLYEVLAVTDANTCSFVQTIFVDGN